MSSDAVPAAVPATPGIPPTPTPPNPSDDASVASMSTAMIPLSSAAATATGNVGELTPYDRIANPMEFVGQFGAMLCKSGMWGIKSVPQGVVFAMQMMSTRKAPFELMATYHIMPDGKLTMRADRMQAEFEAAGGEIKWISIGDDGTEARAKFRRKKGDWLEVGFTIQEAKRAGLIKAGGAWEKNPGAMLRARLISKAVRIVHPGILCGLHAPEDMGDTSTEVIDAEYVQTTVGSKAETTAAIVEGVNPEWSVTTKTATTPTPAATQSPMPATTPTVEPTTPVVAPVVATVGVSVAPTTAPVATPSPTNVPPDFDSANSATIVAPAEPPKLISPEQFQTIGGLVRNDLKLPKESFLALVGRHKHWSTGAPLTSVKEFTADQAESLIVGLREELKKRQLSNWANGATAASGASASAAEIARPNL